jgi:penicillin-binding protein 1A
MASKESRSRAEVKRITSSNGRSRLRLLWFPLALILALSAGGLTGVYAAYQLNYSRTAEAVAALATYRPSVVTRVYADDGKTVIGEFALERRIPLKHDEIPIVMRNAILAVEDTRFYQHNGIDPIRIVGVVLKNFRTGSKEGGSTLTQQLAKNLFLTREQTLTRKVNEWLVALQIERYYTKKQIMEMYANHVFLGAGAYGVEAASETYFGHPAKDLTIEEAALLAGIPKAPGSLAPTVNMQAATERRNLVIGLMTQHGYISEAEAAEAKAKPIKLADTAYYPGITKSSPYDYPLEEIRQYLEDKYTTRVAQGGLTVYSTINVEAQKKAMEVVRKRLRAYWGSRKGEYLSISTTESGTVTQQQLDNYKHPDWYGNQYEVGQYLKGLIMKVDQARNEATVRFGSYTAKVTSSDMGKSGGAVRTEFKIGNLCEFEIKAVDEDNKRLEVGLNQIPEVQAAMVTLNAHTGEIVTMAGGYDFTTSKFNNATQGLRQTGSSFKPYVYTTAIEWGMTPGTIVSGAPFKQGKWQPHNYDGSLGHGDVPLRVAIAKSYNIAAVRLLNMVGVQTGSQMVRRFGITVPMAPYLPSALGATEVPLIEMVSAYSAFPNKGIRVQPHLIRKVLDRDGNVLEQWEKTTYKVTSEYVALTMVDMMRGVCSGGGTAPGANAAGHPLAGKTGTVNDHTDVWFIGYTPTYVTGVWMGYPERKQNLGAGMTGGGGALPYFNDFMSWFMKDKPKEKFDPPPPMPPDIKELNRQREREMAEERAKDGEAETETKTEGTTPGGITDTSPDNVTLPPGPGERTEDTQPKPHPNSDKPKPNPNTDTPPPKPQTRPREVEGPSKKGKRGNDDP